MDAGVVAAPEARSKDAAIADSTPSPTRPAGFSKLERGPTGFGTRAGASRPALVHAPGKGATAEPLVVFLHGMCAIPEWECPVFVGAAKQAWLLCPPGPAACNGGGRMWIGKDAQLVGQVRAFSDALETAHSAQIGRRALVGYSLGAPAALRIALASPGRYQRLMIVNASVTPSVAQLEKAQVLRLALVAGDNDRTAAKLRRAAGALARAGFDARFFSLGPVGHFFDASSARRMEPALLWLTDSMH